MGFENLGTFKASLFASKKETERSATNKQRRLALAVLQGVVEKTPVDTGRARNNWQTTINQPAEGERLGDPISEGAQTIGGAPFGSTIFIANNVPYIKRLEEGSSQQAPAGMVAVSVREAEARIL